MKVLLIGNYIDPYKVLDKSDDIDVKVLWGDHGGKVKARFITPMCSGLHSKDFIYTKYIPPQNIADIVRLSMVVYRLLKKERFDVIHANGTGLLISAFISMLFLPYRIPIVVMSHTSFAWKNNFKILWRSFLYRLMAKEFLALASFQREKLIKYGFPERNIKLISHLIDVKKFKCNHKIRIEIKKMLKKFDIDESYKIISCIGVLSPQGGQEYFIRAVPNILKYLDKNFKIKFLIVGENKPCYSQYDLKLKKLSKKLRCENYIVYTGGIEHQLIPGLLAVTDVVVIPSFYEVLPIRLLEAMAAGKPIIATRVGGIPDFIINHNTGILVDPSDIEAIAKSVVNLLKDPFLSKKLGQKAREMVLKNCTKHILKKKLLNIYRDSLNIKKG